MEDEEMKRRSLPKMLLALFAVLSVSFISPTLAYPDPDPKIFVDPPVIIDTSLVPPDAYFPVKINVSDIPTPGLVAFEFYLKWNASMMGQLGYMYCEEGEFLRRGVVTGGTYFGYKEYYDVDGFDYLYVYGSLTGSFPQGEVKPVPGSGTLAIIWFYPVEAVGTTFLDVYNTKLLTIGLGYEQVPIEHISEDGFFTNKETAQSTNPVTAAGQNFDIFVEALTDTLVSDFTFDENQALISFNVAGPSDTIGFCNITIPQSLMWGNWVILVDGLPPSPDPIITSDGTYTYIFLVLSFSTHAIQIQSSEIVPEFPAVILLPLLFLATLAAAILGEKIRSRTPRGCSVAK